MATISVLLVDDHPDSLNVFATILRHHGYTVLQASGAADALRMTHAAAPAIVVTDLNMPGMDGASMIRVMKLDPALAGIPILVVTADTTVEARSEAESAGCSAFAVKPLAPRALLAAVMALSDSDPAS